MAKACPCVYRCLYVRVSVFYGPRRQRCVWPSMYAGGRQVLLNLLTARLSNTFEENDKNARQGWKLHRARILVRIDASMTEPQRTAPDKIFWQTSPSEPRERCGAYCSDAVRARARVDLESRSLFEAHPFTPTLRQRHPFHGPDPSSTLISLYDVYR